jgi:hypothetical protein
MNGVLTFSSGWSLSAAVTHAERLGCDVLQARKPAPNAGIMVDVRMDRRAADRVAFAVLKRELRFLRGERLVKVTN